VKIEIFDPPMCCSSGICGPGVDPVTVKMNDTILALKKQNVVVERYNPKAQTAIFVENRTVLDLLHENGKKILPVILVNEKVFRVGAYPSYEDLCKELGIEPLKKGKPVTLQVEQHQ